MVALILPIMDVAVILSWLFWFTNEPIGYCIQNEHKEGYKQQARAQIKALFADSVGDDEQKVTSIY